MGRIGKAEEVVPRICNEELSGRVTKIVTQKETNCFWVNKLEKIEAALVANKSAAKLETYTYNLFGEAEGQDLDVVYPTNFNEMQSWTTKAQPMRIPHFNFTSGSERMNVDPGTIPSSKDLYQSMTERWTSTWKDM